MTLLDIGTGRGGDVPKWTSFDPKTKKNTLLFRKLILVEPEAKYFPELKKRLRMFGYAETDYRIVHARGQDTALIMAAMREEGILSVDIVSVMFSMTFMYESREILRAFATTCQLALKPGGKMLFFTLDGMALKEISFHVHRGMANRVVGNVMERAGASATTMVLENDLYTIKFQNHGKEIYTKIRSKVVDEIIEYPAILPELLELFSERLNPDYSIHRADEELFLSAVERLYSRVYSYGVLTLN